MSGRGRRRAGRAGWAALALLASLPHASAATVTVQPGGLAAALAAAAPGDVLHLAPGEHQGPVLVDKPLALEGEVGAPLAQHVPNGAGA